MTSKAKSKKSSARVKKAVASKPKQAKKNAAVKAAKSKKLASPARAAKPKSQPIKAATPSKTAPVKATVVETQVAVPTRAPVRRIIGASNVVTQVAPAKPAAQPEVPLSLVVPTPQAEPAQVRAAKIASAEIRPAELKKPVELSPQLAWTSLPRYMPAHIRFLLGMAFKECEQAGSSPFPLAKFISSLPQDICGLQLAILLLSLEHSVDRISELCRLEPDFVEATLETAKNNVLQKFTSVCGDMSRKLRTQLSGAGIGVESIMDQYLIDKVDRSFQVMLGAVILKVLADKAANPMARSA